MNKQIKNSTNRRRFSTISSSNKLRQTKKVTGNVKTKVHVFKIGKISLARTKGLYGLLAKKIKWTKVSIVIANKNNKKLLSFLKALENIERKIFKVVKSPNIPIKSLAVASVFLILFSISYQFIIEWNKSVGYALEPSSEALLFEKRPELAGYFTNNTEEKMITFNENFVQSSFQSGQSNEPKYKATFHTDPSEGISVTDPMYNTTITIKPKFRVKSPKQDDNRIIYPLLGTSAVKVVTLATIGYKEDIILYEPDSDRLDYEYELVLPDGVEARLENDGSIGFYGVDSALLGDVSTSTDEDADLLKQARQNAEKTNLLFRSPPPYVFENKQELSSANAWYTLDGNTLTLHASELLQASYPLSIDPSIYIETAAKLMRGNNETNVDFDVNNQLIQKGSTTGARIDDWSSTMSLNDDRWNGGTAVAGGYIYNIGGVSSNVTTVVYSATGSDTFNVPSGVNEITVRTWGAGGGGGGGSTNGDGGPGGGGGFAQATISVTPSETLNVVVGGGGGAGTFSSGGSGNNSGDGGGGGGHSEINRSGTALIVGAGGGGGGGGDNSSSTPGGSGAPGGGTTGSTGGSSSSAPGGDGGTPTTGGNGGDNGGNGGSNGSSEQGGDGGNGSGSEGDGDGGMNNGGVNGGGHGGTADVGGNGFGAGGGAGGGYYGGGGGSSSISGNAGGGGGGGGSSYTTGTSTTITAGSGQTPGNNTDPSRAGAGEGGGGGSGTSPGTGTNGTDGIVVITYSTATDDTVSYVRSGGTSGTSFSFDIGTASTNRLVVIMADDESTGTNLTGATVDSNACNLVTIADNNSGAGNHQEMWYCDEDDLGSSNGSVTVAITGGDSGWAVHAHLYTGVSQGGPGDYGIDNTSVSTTTTTVNGIDVPANGLVVMGAGNGQSGSWNDGGWTSPLTERTDSNYPSSAVFATASAIETSVQTNKTYTATASTTHNRASGIVASWDHGLVGSSGGEVQDTVYWARLSTTNSAIESPNPGAGVCTDWCTDSAYDLPDERAGFSLVAYNGFLYVIGGYDSSGTRSDNVYIAKLGANGEPSLWHPTDTNKNNWNYWYQSATYDLTSARSYLSAVAYNNRLYVLGGSTSGSPGGITTVEYTNLSPTGLYGSWSSTGMSALPSARHSHSSHVYNDYIYLIGGNSSGTLQNSVHYAKINNDGTMNSWVSTSSFATARSTGGGVYTVVWGGYIYIAGGCSAVNGSGYCTTVQTDTQLASINADGSLGPWASMSNVSNSRIGFGFVSWRNAIYRVGGCSTQDSSTGACNQSLLSADYGVINPAGEVSTVNISVPSGSSPCSGGSPVNCDLPPPGDDAGEGGQLLSATTILNGYLYVIGGCIDYDCSGTNPAGDDDDVSGNISYVSIGSDGSLSAPSTCSGTSYGAWCVDSTNRVNGTTGVAAAGITTFNNRIYIVGGLTGSGISPNIYYNSTNPDGSLRGAWDSVDMTTAGIAEDVAYTYAYTRANPASASTNPGNLFIFGGCGSISSGAGCSSSDYETEVYKCNITTSGSVSGCTTSGQLQIDSTPGYGGNDGLGIHSGTVYANYIFLVGGYSQSEGDKDDVIYAQFDNNNNVVAVSGSNWIESPNKLSIGRRRGWAFGYNGHIYAVGGYDDTGTGIIPFIEWSKMNVSDGSIDSFITSSVTINQRWGLSMAVSNSYAYVIGGCDVGSSPSGCSSFEPSVQTFQLYNNDSGTPASYSASANQFGTDRLGASSTVLNGYIYVAGGCVSADDCTDATNNVQYAQLDAYGGIGTWSSTTANLPADRAWGQLETAGGSLYYIGGQSDTSTDERTEVYYATPSSGNITSWSTASNGLPSARTQMGATVWNNRIYVTGGNNTSASAQTTVYVSPQLNSGGNISSSWSTTTAFNVARNGHTTIAYANNLYVLGGYSGSEYLSDVQYAQINSNGTVDSWSYTTSLPTPLRQADGFAYNGYLYMFGGRSDDSTCLSRTLVTPISANTTIATGNNPTGVGEWYETNKRYSGQRYGNAAAYYNGKAYVLGGACPSASAPAVQSLTQTSFDSNTTTHNVSMPATVASGDLLLTLFTNDGNATVTDPDGAGGWTSVSSTANGSNVRATVYAKVAGGTEGGTTVNFATSASERAAAQVYRVLAADWYGSIANGVDATGASGGNTSSPDPGSLNPANWGAESTLWLAYAAGSTHNSLSSYPTNYTNGAYTVTGTTNNSGAGAASARQAILTDSENPGNFTMGSSAQSVAYTVAIRPSLALIKTGADRAAQTALLSQPQVAKYSRMIDTDTDVFPNRWLMNGVDNSIGAFWQNRYRSSTAATAAWGQETNFGDVTLGNVEDYVPLDGTGTDTEFARYFYFSVSIDASQTFGYPDDVSRGPTITDITLFFTSDPGKRLRHGKTFTGGEKQPLDTPPGP